MNEIWVIEQTTDGVNYTPNTLKNTSEVEAYSTESVALESIKWIGVSNFRATKYKPA